MEDVIKSEYPLTPLIDKNEIRFENVNIGETIYSNLLYTFTNGKTYRVKIYGLWKFYIHKWNRDFVLIKFLCFINIYSQNLSLTLLIPKVINVVLFGVLMVEM